MGVGYDPTGLGRWCWTRFRGKDCVVLRVVSVYLPVPPPGGNQPAKTRSVYQQHLNYFNRKKMEREPRAAFIADLDAALTSWIATGDQIIVGGDFNEDILRPAITDIFTKHDMHHMIFTKHDHQQFPSTCGRASGNRPIDGIWGTANLEPTQCGYLAVGDFPGDHHSLWLDLTYEAAFGHRPPPTT